MENTQIWAHLKIILPSLTQNKHLWRCHVIIYLDCVISKNNFSTKNEVFRKPTKNLNMKCLKGHKSQRSPFEGDLLMYLSLFSPCICIYICRCFFVGLGMFSHHSDQMKVFRMSLCVPKSKGVWLTEWLSEWVWVTLSHIELSSDCVWTAKNITKGRTEEQTRGIEILGIW